MGIKGLNKFLRSVAPDVYTNINISLFKYKKIAVDTSLYVYKFKTIFEDRWLNSILNLIVCLRRNEIHPCFIFDSGSQIDKKDEKDKRIKQKGELIIRIDKYTTSLFKYYKTKEIDEVLMGLYENNRVESKKLLLIGDGNEENFDIGIVENAIERMQKNVIDVTSEDFNLVKSLLKILNIPFFDAPLEAETMCADLCRRNVVDSLLSEDSDVLNLGTPISISKLNSSTGACTLICYDQILHDLELKQEEFTDLCIMCGNDYNKNIPRIGPCKAYKLIKEYSSIENIEKSGIDVKILNHVRSRELFDCSLQMKNAQKEKNIKEITYVPYCGKPNYEKFEEFRIIHRIAMSCDELRNLYERKITIQE